MKRYLLLTMLCVLAAVGVKAAKVSASGISGTTDTSVYGKKIQTLNVTTPGALAAWVESITGDNFDANNPFGGFGGSDDFTDLQITGTLNAADFEALSSVTCPAFSRFPTVDLSGVTLDEGTSEDVVFGVDFSSSTYQFSSGTGEGAKYLRLPNGLTSDENVVSMSGMKTGKNDALLVVGATNDDMTIVAAHSFQSNECANFISKALPSNFLGTSTEVVGSGIAKTTVGNLVSASEPVEHTFTVGKECIKLSGNLGDKDLVNGPNNVIWGYDVWSFDFTGATFDDNITVNLTSTGTYQTNADGSYNNDPFAEGTPATISCTSTNAFYYISSYSQNIGAIKLPTGNSEIPPMCLGSIGNSRKWQDGDTQYQVTLDVVIPSNITTIGFEAFRQGKIKKLTFECGTDGSAGGIQTIGPGAFSNPTHLTDVEFEGKLRDNVTIEAQAFTQCELLNHLSLPEGISSIGQLAFHNSTVLESIRLPETLHNIGNGCFGLTRSLMSITFPAQVRKIGKQCFGNSAIKDIYLTCTDPDDLPEIFSIGTSMSADTNSTFGDNQVIDISTDPVGFDKTTRTTDYNWEEGCDQYYFARNCALLHFPEELSEALLVSMSEKYGYVSTADGSRFPMRDNGDFLRRAGSYLGDITIEGETVSSGTPVYNDLGSNGQGNYTKHAWAQFVLMKAYKADPHEEEIVYSKQYEDVWYTMCFPFHLTDEQLATAFNEGFNIADFSAVELTQDDETHKRLTLHFNSVAKAKYLDQFDQEYEDLGKGADGYHTYKRNGVTYKHISITSNSAGAKTFVQQGYENTDALELPEDIHVFIIDGVLAQAGHPYMIHPNKGTAVGVPNTSYFSGITWFPEDQRETIYNREVRTVDLGVANTENNYNQVAYEGYVGQTYTFKGNWRAYKDGWQSDESVGEKPTFNLSKPVKRVRPTLDEVNALKPAGEEVTEDGEFPLPEVTNPEIDKVTYPDAFQNFYKKEETFYIIGETTTGGNAVINHNLSDLCYNYGQGYTDNNGPLSRYFGRNFTEEEFNALKDQCVNFRKALGDYQTYKAKLDDYTATHTLYLAWEKYRQASADYNNWNQTAVDNEYATAMSEYEAAEKAYQSALATWQTAMAKYNMLIPKNAYFLARRPGEYPKYFREVADDTKPRTTGLWTQYTAIVMPNEDAVNGIESELDAQTASAKGFEMIFDKDFWVDETNLIKNVIKEGDKVEYMDIVVSIDGRVVRRGSTSLDGLPRGLYIVNGKKYFVK